MPFDFGSFFTPRFPVIKRDRSNEPLGPELPPDFDYDKYGLDDRPEWKKKIQGLFESGVDTAAGFLGLPAYPETRSYGMGELTNAGIPFLALGKKLKLPEINKKPIVYRGDPGVSEAGVAYREINPQFYNKVDTLGHMTHAAEDLDYATHSYAYRKGSPIPNNQMEWYHPNARARPNVTPLTSTAQNAVDLTRLPEDPADVEKLIKSLKQWNPERSPFGEAERLTRKRADALVDEIPHLYRRQMDLDKKIREGSRLTASDDRVANEIVMEMKDIRAALNDPDIAKGTKFDAIRYDDEGKTSWAFPDISKLETPWGTKIGSKSMGDYPFRLSSTSGGSEHEQLGHFATKKEALKFGAKKFPEEYPKLKVYLGTDPVGNVRKANLIDEEINLNPGLKNYLRTDEKIQKQVAASAYKSAIPEKSLLDGYANKMYNNKYDDLNAWQKWDVESKLKNDQKSVGVFDDADQITKSTASQQAAQNKLANDLHGLQYEELSSFAKENVDEILASEAGNKVYGLGDDYDYDFEATDAPYHDVEYGGSYSKPKVSESLKDKIKFKIAKEDYGDDYYNLSKDSKKNVDDIYETLVNNPVDDINWLKKQYPSIADELDEVYGTAPVPKTQGKLKAAADKLKMSGNNPPKYKVLGMGEKLEMGGKEYSVKMPVSVEEALDDLSYSEFGKAYEQLGAAQKEYIGHALKLSKKK
jgi:hypothetical protein